MSWVAAAIVASAAINYASSRSASKEAAKASEREAAAIAEADRKAEARLEEQRKLGQPGIDLLKRTVAEDPNILTPGQQAGLEDARRQTIRGLAASGLRGAGRTTTAAVRDTERRFSGDAIEANRGRQVDAGNRLAAAGIEGFTNSANLATQTGARQANVLRNAGENAANAKLEQGDNVASTISSLAGFIADDQKRASRERKYGDQEQQVA